MSRARWSSIPPGALQARLTHRENASRKTPAGVERLARAMHQIPEQVPHLLEMAPALQKLGEESKNFLKSVTVE